jgi:hypothetical protein
MALKRDFTEEEAYGLTHEEIKAGVRYLRKNKTAGRIPEPESLKLFELYLIGHSFHEILQQFPQYELGQVVLTAALGRWACDRDKMQHHLRDRVQAKVVKSVIEQVDFLTALLSVNNAQHLDAMRRFIADPINNPLPGLKIESIKEYKEVVETLYKIIAGSTPGSKSQTSPLYNALAPSNRKLESDKPKEITAANLIDAQVTEDE